MTQATATEVQPIGKALATFDPLLASAKAIAAPAMKIKIASVETQKSAEKVGKEIRTLTKEIEERRKAIVGPPNEYVKSVNSYAKTLMAELEGAESHIKKQLVAWSAELDKVRAEEARKLDEARLAAEAELRAKAEAAREESEMAKLFQPEEEVRVQTAISDAALVREENLLSKAVAQSAKTVANIKVSGTRKVWSFEITDADLLPREFLIPDESAIRKAMNAGVREIPGVVFEEKTQVSFR